MNNKKKERIQRFMVLKTGEILLLALIIWASHKIGYKISSCPENTLACDSVFDTILNTLAGFLIVAFSIIIIGFLIGFLILWIKANWELAK